MHLALSQTVGTYMLSPWRQASNTTYWLSREYLVSTVTRNTRRIYAFPLELYV